jgi:signal transduction histidine kinase
MKNRLSKLFGSRKSSFLPFEPTNRRIKVSLHQLINDLLTSLQPLARSRNNVILNGVPQGLCFIAEENMLAFKLWNLLGHALQSHHNERIHVFALVDDHQTTISVENAGQNYALSIPNTRLAI